MWVLLSSSVTRLTQSNALEKSRKTPQECCRFFNPSITILSSDTTACQLPFLKPNGLQESWLSIHNIFNNSILKQAFSNTLLIIGRIETADRPIITNNVSLALFKNGCYSSNFEDGEKDTCLKWTTSHIVSGQWLKNILMNIFLY